MGALTEIRQVASGLLVCVLSDIEHLLVLFSSSHHALLLADQLYHARLYIDSCSPRANTSFEKKNKIKQPKNSSSEIPYQLAAVTWMAQLRQRFFFNLAYSFLGEA